MGAELFAFRPTPAARPARSQEGVGGERIAAMHFALVGDAYHDDKQAGRGTNSGRSPVPHSHRLLGRVWRATAYLHRMLDQAWPSS